MFTKKYKVRASEVDFLNKMKISSLVTYFQEAAYLHAIELGFGYSAKSEENWFWVLSRLKFQIHKFPSFNEEITIHTSTKGFNRLFAIRDFEVVDSSKKIIAKASSYWLMVDKKNLRPLRPKKHLKEYDTESTPFFKVDKIKVKDFNKMRNFHEIQYNDVDINNHTNNVRYVEIIENSLGKDFYENYNINEMQINFINETKFSDEIGLNTSTEENTIHYVGVKINSKKDVFRSTIKFE